MDTTLFPKKFLSPEIELKPFLWVYENKPDFVDFTVHEMEKPTGFFKVWREYCVNKTNSDESNAKPRPNNETT